MFEPAVRRLERELAVRYWFQETKRSHHTRTERSRPNRLAFESLEPRLVLDAGPLVISEFMAINDGTLADADGEFSDWIEIHNPTAGPVNLGGWSLTDDQSDLARWRFPAVELQPDEYLVVFASGKDRGEPERELHTDFQLDGSGEYLALVQPDGSTVAHQFTPEFPAQHEDVSYGIIAESTILVAQGCELRYRVPTAADASLGTAWTALDFDDSTWLGDSNTTTGIGFNTNPIGTGPSQFISPITVPFASGDPYPGDGDSDPTYAATKAIDGMPETFCCLLDDTLTGQSTGTIPDYAGAPVTGHMIFDLGREYWVDGAELTGVLHGPAYNPKDVDFFYYADDNPYNNAVVDDIEGDADIRLLAPEHTYAALGSGVTEAVSWQGKPIRYVGMRINSSYESAYPHYNYQIAEIEFSAQEIGFDGIQTDVGNAMQGDNASIWTRISFDASEMPDAQALSLRVKYNDGFVAYLNGHEIARRGAPASVGWDATATAERTAEETGQFETIDVTDFLDEVLVGTNVLAIQGLNVEAADDSFLLLPELIATGSRQSKRYFSEATPGEPNTPGFIDYVADTQFSADRGLFDEPFYLEITCATEGATIWYTTDGSEPTASHGTIYEHAVAIYKTTCVRAAAFKEDFEPTNVDTQTYLFLEDVLTQTRPNGYPTATEDPRYQLDYAVDPDVVNDPLYGDQILDSLKSLPTMSIVMDVDDLFGTEYGIYANAMQEGEAWERATSIEWIDPDAGDGFQIDAAIRMQGALSRNPLDSPKHNFRLIFKEPYGPSKLEFPVFDDSPVDTFDQLILRNPTHDSWLTNFPDWNDDATYAADQWHRATQADMGHLSTHGQFVHLYLNGLYWGVYEVTERPNDSFVASYENAEKEEYDAISGGYLRDGDLAAWNTMNAIAKGQGLYGSIANAAAYEEIQQYLDVVQMVDYLIYNVYSSNMDWPWKNYWAVRKREPDGQFRFYSWDAEASFWTNWQPETSLYFNMLQNERFFREEDGAGFLYTCLKANGEFRLLVADRLRKHLANGGALTPEVSAARFQEQLDNIEPALVAESARWGDTWRPNDPFTKQDWLDNQVWLFEEFFPKRTEIVLDDFRADGVYPALEAVSFNQHGGQVDWGFELSMAAPTGAIYYTLDGSDPRLPAGEAATVDLVPQHAQWKYADDGFEPVGTWRELDYDDANWNTGFAEFGYGDGDEATVVSYGPNPSAKYVTTYFRHVFEVDDPGALGELTLSLLRDDGAAVYLNGYEIVHSNLPQGTIEYDTFASARIGIPEEATFYEFSVNPRLLHAGPNILAVEVHQADLDSSDLSFDLMLQEASAGAARVSPGALEYSGVPVVLLESATVKARVCHGGSWSAINEAEFIVGVSASAENLSVVEINYHPADARAGEPAVDADEFEFIELQNTSNEIVQLAGVEFVEGITFDFDTSSLAELQPGERIVLVANQAAFQARYGTAIAVAGVYEGHLSNSGERLVLHDAFGGAILDFEYGDSGAWPGRADGGGSSLVRISTTVEASDAQNWRSSTTVGGTPGGEPYSSPVVVNEILAHTDFPLSDSIELFNRSGAPVDISGWYVSDSSADFGKFKIPSGTILPVGEFIVFDETDFGSIGTPDAFALSGAYGDDVWLTRLDAAGNPTHFVDHAEFGPTTNGVSLGRYPDGSGPLAPMPTLSLGDKNGIPKTPDVVISEVQYHPTDETATSLEYVELLNTTDTPVDLSGYRLLDGITFAFPEGTTLDPRRTLLVTAFDPADGEALVDFYLHYGSFIEPGATLAILGPFTGALNNAGEHVSLSRPDDPPADDPAYTPMIVVDEIDYNDQPPWPEEANGQGMALHRRSLRVWGTEPDAWIAAPPSLGTSSAVFGVPGDLNGDGSVAAADLDLVRANWGKHVPAGDLSQGDASWDGRVGADDLDLVRANWGSAPAASIAASTAKNAIRAAPSAFIGPRRASAIDAALASLSDPPTEPRLSRHDLTQLAEAAWLNELEGLRRKQRGRESFFRVFY